MTKTAILLGTALCLSLSACAPAPVAETAAAASTMAAPASPAPEAPPVPVPVQNSAEIAGAWDVASFEGYEPRRLSETNRAAFADFGPAGVGLRIECNYSGRSGTVTGGRFVRVPDDAIQTAMGCGPVGNARESRYFSFFEKNPTVERLGPGRLRLRSGGTELILERPALRRLKFVPTPASSRASGGSFN